MNFKKACLKLKKLANSVNEDFYSVRYEAGYSYNKIYKITCEVYINNYGLSSAETFKAALKLMELKINISSKKLTINDEKALNEAP